MLQVLTTRKTSRAYGYPLVLRVDDPRFGIRLDGRTDCTSGLREMARYANARGSAIFEFYDADLVFGDQFQNTSAAVNEVAIALTSLQGVELRGAPHIIHRRNYPIDAVRCSFVKFTSCIGVKLFDGAFFEYTGDRDDNDPAASPTNNAAYMYRRGLTPYHFGTGNEGVILGNARVSDCGIMLWHQNAGAYTAGSRRFGQGIFKGTRCGYGFICDRGPHIVHDLTIETDACGRSLKCEDVYDHRNIRVRSKDHDAGENVGYALGAEGILHDIDLHYEDVGSTLAGRGVGVIIPTVGVAGTAKNIRVSASAVVTGAADLGYLVKVGLSSGTASAHADFRIENLVIDGFYLDSRDADVPADTKGMLFSHPAGWSTADNLKSIAVRNYRHHGGGLTGFDLTGLVDQALFQNVYSDSDIQQVGNQVGEIVNDTCNVGEFCETSDQSNVTYRNCIVRQDTGFSPKQSFLNKVFFNTLVDDVRFDQYNSFQFVRERIPSVPFSGSYSSLGTAVSHVAGTIYAIAIEVVTPGLYTGVSILNGGTVGTSNRIAAIYDEQGLKLGNSVLSGTQSLGANVFQNLAFTAQIRIPSPGRYYIAVQADNNTDNMRMVAASTFHCNYTIAQAGAFGTLANLSPLPTAFVADVGPIATLYA
jgi:hypothetical protein